MVSKYFAECFTISYQFLKTPVLKHEKTLISYKYIMVQNSISMSTYTIKQPCHKVLTHKTAEIKGLKVPRESKSFRWKCGKQATTTQKE